MRRFLVSLAMAGMVALAACGSTASPAIATSPVTGSPGVTALPTPTPATFATPAPGVAVVGTGASDPLTAVKDITGGSSFCTTSWTTPPCPVTQRLGDRLNSSPFSGYSTGASPVCRCQNAPQLTYTLASDNGTSAYVAFNVGAGAATLRWTVLLVNGSWYADDQDLGCASTSIYNPAYNRPTSASATPAPAAPASC